jgi:hypothetical protein
LHRRDEQTTVLLSSHRSIDSRSHPRKEDHAGIVDCHISRMENGKLQMKKGIPKEERAKNMPFRHDLSETPV